MQYLALAAALLFCGSGEAATYVYQSNASNGYGGQCGAELAPFQITITVDVPFPANATLNNTPVQTIAVSADGGVHQWGTAATKRHPLLESFTTDSNGVIIQWAAAAGKSRKLEFYTRNVPNNVNDLVVFHCGDAGVAGNPGVWTRTE
jgi:hypothetical protein